jgi:DUF917 family protein
MPRVMTKEDVEALAIGGSILGGGGGGWAKDGRRTGLLALEIGEVILYGPDEADPDWIVVTTAALGAPTQRGKTKPYHFIRSAQLLLESGVEFHGFIAAENGGHNSFGGWIPAAALGLPVIDTPGDGRAHPTAMMGSMGLHRHGYESVKAGVTEGSEMLTWGSLETTSKMIRAQAREMEALIAMSRDPVPVSYTRKHGAPGAIAFAIELGKTFLEGRSPDEKVQKATDFLGGKQICEGTVTTKFIEAKGGFDTGFITIKSGESLWELTYVNEYMTLEHENRRLATFPDLMATFDNQGYPINSAAIEPGDELYLIVVDKEKIPVGDGNKYSENYRGIEDALGKPMVEFLKGYLIS